MLIRDESIQWYKVETFSPRTEWRSSGANVSEALACMGEPCYALVQRSENEFAAIARVGEGSELVEVIGSTEAEAAEAMRSHFRHLTGRFMDTDRRPL